MSEDDVEKIGNGISHAGGALPTPVMLSPMIFMQMQQHAAGNIIEHSLNLYKANMRIFFGLNA